jgi:sugar phosphate isomerase/epimerase
MRIKFPSTISNIPNQKDEDFLSFYSKAKQLLGNQLAGHAMDAPHRFITEGDNWLKPPKELLREVVYVHITDCTREFDSHLPLGQGEMPFNDFFALLKSINYQGIINQEIKPKGLDLESIMDSSLLCVKPFSRLRYLRLKTKYAFLRPILRRKITAMANRQKNKSV